MNGENRDKMKNNKGKEKVKHVINDVMRSEDRLERNK